MKKILILALIGYGLWQLHQKHPGYLMGLGRIAVPSLESARPGAWSASADRSPLTTDRPAKAVGTAQGYRCDGRTHCPQMRSCDEAMFFLKNCPRVEMDGEGDGIPCERQWCDHWSSCRLRQVEPPNTVLAAWT